MSFLMLYQEDTMYRYIKEHILTVTFLLSNQVSQWYEKPNIPELNISGSPVAGDKVKVWFGLVNHVCYLSDVTRQQNK